jgi:hypothetical protein
MVGHGVRHLIKESDGLFDVQEPLGRFPEVGHRGHLAASSHPLRIGIGV